MTLSSLIHAVSVQGQISFFININHLLCKMTITCLDQIFMMAQFVSLVEVHFIHTSCNIKISQSYRLTSFTMIFSEHMAFPRMPHKLDSQILHFNIFLKAFNSIMMQWKDQFKEITQWNNFKIFHLKLLENNLKKENDYIIHSYLRNYNNLF